MVSGVVLVVVEIPVGVVSFVGTGEKAMADVVDWAPLIGVVPSDGSVETEVTVAAEDVASFEVVPSVPNGSFVGAAVIGVGKVAVDMISVDTAPAVDAVERSVSAVVTGGIIVEAGDWGVLVAVMGSADGSMLGGTVTAVATVSLGVETGVVSPDVRGSAVDDHCEVSGTKEDSGRSVSVGLLDDDGHSP